MAMSTDSRGGGRESSCNGSVMTRAKGCVPGENTVRGRDMGMEFIV